MGSIWGVRVSFVEQGAVKLYACLSAVYIRTLPSIGIGRRCNEFSGANSTRTKMCGFGMHCLRKGFACQPRRCLPATLSGAMRCVREQYHKYVPIQFRFLRLFPYEASVLIKVQWRSSVSHCIVFFSTNLHGQYLNELTLCEFPHLNALVSPSRFF